MVTGEICCAVKYFVVLRTMRFAMTSITKYVLYSLYCTLRNTIIFSISINSTTLLSTHPIPYTPRTQHNQENTNPSQSPPSQNTTPRPSTGLTHNRPRKSSLKHGCVSTSHPQTSQVSTTWVERTRNLPPTGH